jgi:predicted aldo/keto reductase-like oxidoreductase
MIYRKLGNTGLTVSRLGFGAMRPPVDENRKIDEDLYLAIIHRAIDLGVTHIDTAYVYAGGDSERIVGRAVRGRRDQLTLSTKVPVRYPAPEWEKKLHESIERLGTHVDLLLFHDLKIKDRNSRSFDATVKRAEKAVRRGYARMLAVSCHEPPETAREFLDTGLFRAILMQYNLLNRTYEETLAYAHERGIGTMVMGPCHGGILAAPSRVLKHISPVKVAHSAELAFRFVLSNPNVDIAFSGMNAFQQVDENCRVASMKTPLTAAQRRKLLRALEERFEIAETVCTGCGYCMPCPHGVDIPACFRALTMKKVWGLDRIARRIYSGIGSRNTQLKNAEACVKCGLCEPKCPQSIPIRKQMDQVRRAFPAGGQ